MDFDTGALQIIDVKGIGPSYTKILNRFRIQTTADFLRNVQHPKDRRKLSKLTGIDEKRITKWASICDLIRIEGVAETWSELLIELGIHSVQSLASEEFSAIWQRLDHHQLKKGDMVKKKPTKEKLKSWMEEAKRLKPAIFFEEDVPKEKPVEVKRPKLEIIMPTRVIEPINVVRESPMAVNHVGAFEKSAILISGIILIAMLVMYALLVINPSFA